MFLRPGGAAACILPVLSLRVRPRETRTRKRACRAEGRPPVEIAADMRRAFEDAGRDVQSDAATRQRGDGATGQMG